MEKIFYEQHLVDHVVNQVITHDTEHCYVLLTANINDGDSWVWKWCPGEYNWIPVHNITQSNCVLNRDELFKELERANEWISVRAASIDRSDSLDLDLRFASRKKINMMQIHVMRVK